MAGGQGSLLAYLESIFLSTYAYEHGF